MKKQKDKNKYSISEAIELLGNGIVNGSIEKLKVKKKVNNETIYYYNSKEIKKKVKGK